MRTGDRGRDKWNGHITSAIREANYLGNLVVEKKRISYSPLSFAWHSIQFQSSFFRSRILF